MVFKKNSKKLKHLMNCLTLMESWFVSLLRKDVKHVATGVFGADMSISIEADGPITIVMESEVLKRKGK